MRGYPAIRCYNAHKLMSWAHQCHEKAPTICSPSSPSHGNVASRARQRNSALPNPLPQPRPISGLEARLGLPLLTRTTRSAAPTEAGERLLDTLGPAFRPDRSNTGWRSARSAKSHPGTSASRRESTQPIQSCGLDYGKLLPDNSGDSGEIFLDNGLSRHRHRSL